MFKRLRWIAIVLPVATIAVIEIVSDTALDEILHFPLDAALVVLVVALLAFVFSSVTFAHIDSLSGQLAQRNAELEARNATIRALNGVSVAITAISGLDRILQAVADEARGLTGADSAALFLDTAPGEMTMRGQSGDGTVLSVADPGSGVSRLEVPLQRGDRTIGTLVVGSRGVRSYGADEVEAIYSLANQAAIAVENAGLQERLRGLAVAEERERIAREMHDGLAQVLGYVNTKSLAVEHLLEDRRIDEARAQLAQLAAAARSIYVDVREAILGLRSAIDPSVGLVVASETYAARFAEASKLVVEVRATDEARAVRLPDQAQSHVFRIVQESLTNVRKHAQARRVKIWFDATEDALGVSIIDDGAGMITSANAASDWPHYGLAAMRERAAAVGGTIEWRAATEGGTVVRLQIPTSSSTLPNPAAPAEQPA